jgi:DNA-binding CsgD family transcriptional regulator
MISENHISYQSVEEVKCISAPLKKLGNIHYFCYGVNYADTSGFTLQTNYDFYASWFENQFPMVGFHLDTGWYRWNTILPEKQLEIAKQWDLGNGIIYIDNQKDKTEILSFATYPDNENALDFYLNNLTLLSKFKQYFLDHAKDILSVANSQLVTPLSTMVLNSKKDINQDSLDSMTHSFLKATFPFNLLSARETECYVMIIKGYTLNDIAKQLNVTLQTVAVYISRIKKKLDCESKKDLFAIANKSENIAYYID